MTYKKGNWVIIKETGKVGQIVIAYEDGTYLIEVDGISTFLDLDLTPAPKTWDTLEVGDIIVDTDGTEEKVLAVMGDVFLRSCSDDFDETQSWYTKKEVQKNGYKIKGGEEEVSEMTVEQISKALGKKVKIVE